MKAITALPFHNINIKFSPFPQKLIKKNCEYRYIHIFIFKRKKNFDNERKIDHEGLTTKKHEAKNENTSKRS